MPRELCEDSERFLQAWMNYKEYLEETTTMTKEEMDKREIWFREAFQTSLGAMSLKQLHSPYEGKIRLKKRKMMKDNTNRF
jgi:hypothetical protein